MNSTLSVAGEVAEGELLESFRRQTFLHAGAVYSDALCLTDSRQQAVELTVETYARAFRGYSQFRRRQAAAPPGTVSALPWLRGQMYAIFCGGILAQQRPPHGGEP